MEPQWKRYLRIVVNQSDVQENAYHYAIRDNGGDIVDLTDEKRSMGVSIITVWDPTVRILTESVARRRISSHEGHLRTFDDIDFKTCYRLTLKDGQRLIYVQSADCFNSFIHRDSHYS